MGYGTIFASVGKWRMSLTDCNEIPSTRNYESKTEIYCRSAAVLNSVQSGAKTCS